MLPEQEKLVNLVLDHSRQQHAHYRQEQHTLWALGFLASVVVEKTYMDTEVWRKMRARLRQLESNNNGTQSTVIPHSPKRL